MLTYNKIRAKPFTRISGKLDWHQKEKLIEEAEGLALDCSVSYPWLHGYGILADIQGDVMYQVQLGQVYVEPLQLPSQHGGIIAGATAIPIHQSETANKLLLCGWAAVKGFWQGISKNVKDALDARYHKQHKERILRYK